MAVDNRIPYIRVLNENKHQGKELWVIASLVRLLNIVRVWLYEVEVRTHIMHTKTEINQKDVEMFENSAMSLAQLIKNSYVVLKSNGSKEELAFFEDAMFKFETLYLTSTVNLIVNEEKIPFHQERYAFLKSSLFSVMHDLTQPISALVVISNLVLRGDSREKSEMFTDVSEVINQTKSQLQRGFEMFSGSFKTEILSVSEMEALSRELLTSLLRPEKIEFVVRNYTRGSSVEYSRIWMRGLLSNIVDNAKKSFRLKGERLGHGDFDRIINVIFREGEPFASGQETIEIAVSDTGVGFDKDILDSGFGSGKSIWQSDALQGQGVGMVTHVEYLKKLGGEVYLHNLGENGEVLGAELVVKLGVATP